MRITLIAIFLLLCCSVVVYSQDSVTEKETNTTFSATYGENPTLHLMGVAPRTKWMFKVYGVGLYADPEAIDALLGDKKANKIMLGAVVRAMSGHRALVLKFVRDIDKGKMSGAFTEAIEKTMPIDDPSIADDASKLLDAFVDVKNGDEAVMYFAGDTIRLLGNGDELLTLENRDLARALLAAYIGSNPIDDNIKEKLLSKRP